MLFLPGLERFWVMTKTKISITSMILRTFDHDLRPIRNSLKGTFDLGYPEGNCHPAIPIIITSLKKRLSKLSQHFFISAQGVWVDNLVYLDIDFGIMVGNKVYPLSVATFPLVSG